MIKIGKPAPDFELADVFGRNICLSDFKEKLVVLALLRGFA